jgi:signal transduction histidine kinase
LSSWDAIELKTPLTSLKLQAQLRTRGIQKGNFAHFAPEKLSKLFSDDERQFNRLTRLVDDMLDVARVQSGRLAYNAEDFDLNEMVKDALQRFAPQFEAAKSAVTFVPDKAAIGHWDRFRIEQVFINLLTNALKYGAGNPVEVQIKVNDAEVSLSVRDHGIGIKKEDQSRIFGQFERAISANTISGLGLGLYISKKIIEAHKGDIIVESEAGKGSNFIVKLPLTKTAEKQAS